MNLFDEIKKTKTDAQVVDVIKQWFALLPEIENKTRFDDRADLYSEAAKSGTSHRAELMEAAKTDLGVWEGLRRYALSQSAAGKAVEPDIVVLALSDPPKQGRGKVSGSGSPYTEAMAMRYARAVWCVYQGGAGRYTLSTNDTNANNAFSIVAQATGATFDQVRNATKNGQLNRLTRLSYLAKQLGVE